MKPKHLNKKTYSNNIRLKDLFFVRYKGLRIAVTKSAMNDMLSYGIDLNDVKKVLEEGTISPRKRKKDIIEKWLDIRNKTMEVVVTRDYNYILNQEEWLLIHCSIFTKRK